MGDRNFLSLEAERYNNALFGDPQGDYSLLGASCLLPRFIHPEG
jgi:hypothetical protein